MTDAEAAAITDALLDLLEAANHLWYRGADLRLVCRGWDALKREYPERLKTLLRARGEGA